MFGIFKTNYCGEMTWLATVDTIEQANEELQDAINKLESEECAMILPLNGFRQMLVEPIA